MTPKYDSDFFKIFQNKLVGMVLSDESHIIVDINDTMLESGELSREDVVGKTALSLNLISEKFIHDIWEEFDTNKILRNKELSFITKTGKSVSFIFSSEQIVLNQKPYQLSTFIDISQRKNSEKELIEVYERVTDGFVAIDKNWNYTYINKTAGVMMNKNPADIMGHNLLEVFPHLVGSDIHEAYEKAMNTQEMITLEQYFPPNDTWYMHMIYPSPDGLSVFFKDISYRKKQEVRIAESELLFRTLTKTAPVGIFETDANGSTTYVNETWLQYTGMHFEEAMGDGWLDAVHPDDREWLQKGWHSKTEIQSESYSEYRLIDKQGRQRWVNGNAVPVFYADGKISGYVGIILDVTERKRAEERIINSEESKRLILNSALDAIVIIDSNSAIIFWNPQAEKIFGWTADEVIGKGLTDTIIPDEHKKAHQLGMQHYLQTGEGSILNKLIEVNACNKDGLFFPIELSILPVEQETGKSFCAFIRNITERKQAETNLKESSEQLRELSRYLQQVREEERLRIAREIHDELGQQLTGIKMDVAWLMRKAGQDDPAVKSKFEDTLSLVDNTVKSIRRISTELRPSIIDDLGLNASLEWQLEEFGGRMNIEIKYENSFNDAGINPDISIGLFRILQESLTNIAKHAAAKKIKISIAEQEDVVVLTVEDDGIGFDKIAKKDRLTFGLIGIQERTSMLQGEYCISSSPGTGTKIKVRIPLKKN